MGELSKEYLVLFHGISSVAKELQSITVQLAILQQQAEQAYIDRICDDPEIVCTKPQSAAAVGSR